MAALDVKCWHCVPLGYGASNTQCLIRGSLKRKRVSSCRQFSIPSSGKDPFMKSFTKKRIAFVYLMCVFGALILPLYRISSGASITSGELWAAGCAFLVALLVATLVIRILGRSHQPPRN